MAVSVRTMDPGEQADLDLVWEMLRLAFDAPRIPEERWVQQAASRRTLVAEVDGRAAGTLAIRPFAQHFGGRAVPMGGIAAVAVSPYARGTGVATRLLAEALPAMREAGQSVSALFASVPPLYRASGWERAGVLEDVTLDLLALRSVRPSAAVPLRPAGESDLDAFQHCYVTIARTIDGSLDRATSAHRTADVLDRDIATLADGPDGLRGALVASRGPGPEGLTCHDLLARDADTALVLLAHLGTWGGHLREVRVRLLDTSVLGALTPTALTGSVDVQPWMFRVIDLPAAVAARGWPRAETLADAVVDLEIDDPLAPWHSGRHRILVEGGSIRCEPGGAGALRLGPRGLAAWYTGAMDSAALRRAGLLVGGSGDGVLDALSAGHGARMSDYF
jgi:predicted acetyltransferase